MSRFKEYWNSVVVTIHSVYFHHHHQIYQMKKKIDLKIFDPNIVLVKLTYRGRGSPHDKFSGGLPNR